MIYISIKMNAGGVKILHAALVNTCLLGVPQSFRALYAYYWTC